MNICVAFSLLFVSLQTLPFILALTSDPKFNASNALHAKTDDSSRFLKDVVKAISLKQSWNFQDVRVSKLDVRNARFGHSQRYEFRLRMGKSNLLLRFWDQESRWKKFGKRARDFGSLISEVSSLALLDTFRIEGPFELSVDNADDELSLSLPINSSYTGLKRVLVGEGITIEVRRAQEVSLFHTSNPGSPLNRSFLINKERSELWSLLHSFCLPLLPIKILGSASLVAYRTHTPDAYIESTFLSKQTIELLPEKCYIRHNYKKQAYPFDFLNLRLAALEKLLRSFLGDRIHQNRLLSFYKAQIKASTVVRFQLELERDVGSNDTRHSALAKWRTRPTVERVWFQVVARVEAERLKPLTIRMLKPFIEADSAAWSNLLSNISFTKFPSVLVPSEALTLDVKW